MDYGTDIQRNWTINEHGDLETIQDIDNLEQAITNRLLCEINTLDIFYRNYGSILTTFLGWKRNQTTLEFIKLELDNRLSQDPRIKEYNIQVEYDEDNPGGVIINITLYPDTNYTHTITLKLDNNGVENIGN